MTVRRLKTYASSQGYVYQYYFAGKRPVADDQDATEYRFDVTSDLKLTYPVTIVVAGGVVAAWAGAHMRQLTDSEQYAAVKLRLFRAFDEVPDLRSAGPLSIETAFLEETLASLGVD
jgi:hypothetical protein